MLIIVQENLVVGISAVAHHGGSDLAQPHSMSPSERQVPHALLTRPPLSSVSIGRILFPQILVRLACVKHAASVRPEPGSNSL